VKGSSKGLSEGVDNTRQKSECDGIEQRLGYRVSTRTGVRIQEPDGEQ
jgi:hypothetical protein